MGVMCWAAAAGGGGGGGGGGKWIGRCMVRIWFVFVFLSFFAWLIFGVFFVFDRPASSHSCAKRILTVMKKKLCLCARQSACKNTLAILARILQATESVR